MADGTAHLMVILITSLMISSTLISFFAMNVYGVKTEVFQPPDLELSSYSSSKDLTTSCNLSDYSYSGNWVCDGTGLKLTGAGQIQTIRGASGTGGHYTNTYHIRNSEGDYYIVIADTNAKEYIHLEVREDGLHIPRITGIPFIGYYEYTDALFIPIQGASTMPDVTIKTDYNTNANLVNAPAGLKINFNGQDYTADVDELPILSSNDIISSEGIGGTRGLSISSMSSNFQAVGASSVDALTMIGSFIANILLIIVWNIDASIFPWQLNFLFIKTQCLGIFICLIALVRGV